MLTVLITCDEVICNIDEAQLVCAGLVDVQQHQVVEALLGHGRPQVSLDATHTAEGTLTGGICCWHYKH